MKISGKIIEINETQQVSENFKKRFFIVEYKENPQYPQYLQFELIKERCGIIDDFEAGQMVEVNFNLIGREWKDKDGKKKYFNSLQAWKIEEEEDSENSGDGNFAGSDDDDTPF